MIYRLSERARPTTFRSSVVRVVAPRVATFAALVAAIALGQAMTVDPSSQSSDRGSADSVGHPSWRAEYAAEYPGCVASYAWPAQQVASSLVVYRYRDRARLRVLFASGWRANHNYTEVDDVWVIGVCR